MATTSDISGDEAAQLISSSAYESYNVVGFDDIEGKRLGVQAGKLVAVAPEDSGYRCLSKVGLRLTCFIDRQKASNRWKARRIEPCGVRFGNKRIDWISDQVPLPKTWLFDQRSCRAAEQTVKGNIQGFA